MHGREGGEDRKLIRHMWSVPSTTTTKTIAGVVDSNGFSASCFYKDGRKISVGDSALFKPAEDSPPFVGIIRSLTSEKESNLKLRVNWLYRPAEVKLPKGVALEAAPNEVFYSFHSDEIPASSLLHPCKVSFLRKGVELPPGVSSFVCRRVYDITNKCLWWLTDQDYIDERQTEINQLLHKTHIEMYGSEQHHGPRSPKPANGSAATSPLKHSPDSVQNSSSNLSSHRKGKKRERGEQSFEAIKRDRSSRPDDGDSGQSRSESFLNLEIARLSEKGGLTDSDTVMRLVRLMQPEKSDKKIGLTGRSMLAGIIAATDKVDCLNQFVQLRGLFVLNEWLQEVHKGKIGDSGNLKSNDKSVDDFLLVLLRALDKLPVNLNALQMCNIGKSVNHLRTHKNAEIQKKARSLVDMWKKRVEAEMKRVEAEMNINDVKCGSNQAVAWPGRSQHESSHGGNRQSSGSDAAIRSSVTHHSSLKAAPVKLVAGESNPKSASAHPIGARSTLSPTSTTDKDGQSKIIANGGCSDHQTVAREERSSSSSQSHNSQCSSEQAKNVVPHGKEGTKGSIAGSRSFNNNVGSGSKHRKSANGPVSGVQKDSASNRSSSLVKNSVSEKASYNATDASPQENNNHKLIVKIPNRSRGLAHSITGGTLEDNSCKNSRASSPVLSEKQDQDASARGNKLDSHQYHEVDGSSTSVTHRTNETRRVSNVSKLACSPSRTEMKSRKSHDSSFSSMNALIESCAKFSEANVPISAADDIGMNLLASVAAREISRSGIVSPAVSPHRNSKLGETSSSSHVGNQKQLHGDDVIQGGQSTDVADTDNDIHVAGISKVDEECNKLCDTKTENSPENVEGCLKSSGTLDDEVGTAAPTVSIACTTGKSEGDLGAESVDKKVPVVKEETQNESPVASHGLVCSLEANNKVASLNDDFEKKAQLDTALYQCDKVKAASLNNDDEKSNVGEGLQANMVLKQNSFVIALQSEPMRTNKKSSMVSCSTSQHMASATPSNFKSEKSDGIDACGLAGQAGNRIPDKESDFSSEPGKEGEPGGCRADLYQGSDCNDQNLDNKEVPAPDRSAVVLPEAEVNSAAEGIKSVVVEEDTKVESGSATDSVAVLPVPGRSTAVVNLGFDLNEGFNVDDGKNGEPADLASGPCCDNVCSVSPLQLPVSSTCSLPASVTVASAAKGPFVPADDLLWSNREFGWILGWKGSAATSAFRPAEPRKVTEAPFGPGTVPLPDAPVYRPGRFPLDIDLNVTDESSGQECIVRNDPVCELMTTSSLRSSGGLDLDLNKVDEAPDMAYGGQQVTSNVQRVEVSAPHVKSSTLNVHSHAAASGKRDFDLNNGPAAEESYAEQISFGQHNRGNITLQPSLGPRINNSDAGNFFSWYPPGTNYSVSVTPSALPDREAFSIVGMGGGPQRALGGPTSTLSFNSDAYRGSVLSSSPALPFHPAPFQYPVLPYGTSFPLSSPALAGGSSGYMDPATGGRVSAIPSQLVGNAAAVSFQYPHAYVVSRSIPDVGSNGVIESNHKWGKQGLDLNSGPGVLDVEGRDESLPTVTRQVSTVSPQSLAEEQARMYCMRGGQPKRKEPEGGWNMDKLNVKQSPWR